MECTAFIPKIPTVRYGENFSYIYIEKNENLKHDEVYSNGKFRLRVISNTLLHMVTNSVHDYVSHSELIEPNWELK